MRIPLNLSLNEAVSHWAKYLPKKAAIISEQGIQTYEDIQQRTSYIRALLRARLSQSGTQIPVGLLLADKPSFVAALCAILAEGHTAIFLNHYCTLKQIAAMIEDSCCKAVLVDDSFLAQSRFTEESLPNTILVASTLKACTDTDTSPLPGCHRFVDDIWGILYSSGTTGKPKGIVRTDFSILSELLGWCIEIPIIRTSTVYIGRPLYYTGGLVLSGATLLVGGTLVLPKEHTVDAFKELSCRHRADLVFLIPDQAAALVRAKTQANSLTDWPAPGTILTMGAPSSVHLKEAICSTLRYGYIESWGNSEGLGTITDEGDVKRRPSSVGRPFVGDRISVLDLKGQEVEVGQIGRLAGRSDSTLKEYRNREDLNSSLITDQYVISEDLGYVDESGYFYIAGRTVERFIRNGIPIFTSDIEHALLEYPFVVEASVVYQEDLEQGAVPLAAVKLSAEASAEGSHVDILHDLNKSLPQQYKLSSVLVVDKLPRNAAGKVERNAVHNMIVASQLRKEPRMETALVVIDAQQVYTNPDSELFCENSKETIININRLIRSFRDRDASIVFVRHLHRPDGTDLGRMFDYAGEESGEFNFKSDSEEVLYSTDLEMPDRRFEIVKNRYSAFEGTDLDDILRNQGINKIVVCGFMTNFCCESTAREAHDKDYFVDFIVDATGTPGTENLDQDKIREIVAELLSAGFAQTYSTDDYLAKAKT